MDIDRYLATAELRDCQARVQYTLTLLIDGRVRVRPRGRGTFEIDPANGDVRPPGTVVPEAVLQAAATLADRPIGKPTGPSHARAHGEHPH